MPASAGFLPELARALAWTPAGAAWSLGGDLAAGQLRAAALKLLIALATLAGLALCWKVLLQRALVTPPYAGSGKKKAAGLGLFALLPATPTGAIAARSLSYWLRDPRYAGSLVVVPLLPVLLLFQASQSGDYGILQFVGPLTAFLLAWSISADVSYDNTAFALHLSTGVRGLHDRLGRALACLVFALPVVLVFSVVPMFLTGDWELLPGDAGPVPGRAVHRAGPVLGGLGALHHAVPLPGDSPFKKPPGNVAPDPGRAVRRHGGPAAAGDPGGGPGGAAARRRQHGAGLDQPGAGPGPGRRPVRRRGPAGRQMVRTRGPELLAQLAVNR